jgi:hypothetical protein
MSDAEILQRSEAGMQSKRHGAYAFRDRGEAALEPSGRTRLAELREYVKDRGGVLELIQEKAADCVLIFEIVQSHVAREVKNGVPLDQIPALRSLPAFMNSMNRALTALITLMPKDGETLDAGMVLDAVRKGKDEEE